MAASDDTASMALFCDFENVALGVRDAQYEKFDIRPVLERLLDTLSYEAPDRDGQSVTIDRAYVDAHLGELVQDPDLSRYIL